MPRPRRTSNGPINDELGPYPRLQSAAMEFRRDAYNTTDKPAVLVGFGERDPREVRRAKPERFERVDSLTAQWEQQVTIEHLPKPKRRGDAENGQQDV